MYLLEQFHILHLNPQLRLSCSYWFWYYYFVYLLSNSNLLFVPFHHLWWCLALRLDLQSETPWIWFKHVVGKHSAVYFHTQIGLVNPTPHHTLLHHPHPSPTDSTHQYFHYFVLASIVWIWWSCLGLLSVNFQIDL